MLGSGIGVKYYVVMLHRPSYVNGKFNWFLLVFVDFIGFYWFLLILVLKFPFMQY